MTEERAVEMIKQEALIQQIENQRKIYSLGFNIVTCGSCGAALTHRVGDTDILCTCGLEMDLSDCPDLYYIENRVSTFESDYSVEIWYNKERPFEVTIIFLNEIYTPLKDGDDPAYKAIRSSETGENYFEYVIIKRKQKLGIIIEFNSLHPKLQEKLRFEVRGL